MLGWGIPIYQLNSTFSAAEGSGKEPIQLFLFKVGISHFTGLMLLPLLPWSSSVYRSAIHSTACCYLQFSYAADKAYRLAYSYVYMLSSTIVTSYIPITDLLFYPQIYCFHSSLLIVAYQ